MSYYQFKKKNTNYLFSPQNLIDCANIYGTEGCNGGWPSYAMKYMQIDHQNLESSYPYKGVDVSFVTLLLLLLL